MRHIFESGPQPRTGDRATNTNTDRFGSSSIGRERVAGDDPDAGRTHVLHEDGTIPGTGKVDPNIEAEPVGFISSLRQYFGDKFLSRGGFVAYEPQQRVGGAVL